MAQVRICGAVISEADFLRMESAGAVVVGSCNSFVYFFNGEGNEIAHLHADLYQFVGLMVHPAPRVWDDSIKASVTVSSFPSYAECVIYSLGDRVKTAFGWGSVEAFERFGVTGNAIEDGDKDNGGRVKVRLDNPLQWPCHKISRGYYAFRSELVKGE